MLGTAVPFPAENIARVTLSPVEVRVSTSDVTTDGNITAVLDSCTTCEDDYTEWGILDQHETFNGMPVYYGNDLYDSEDWDDPYAIASAAYVEDYNFDVPEGMDLMVQHHRLDPDNSDIRQNWQTGITPVCQTMSCVIRDEWDALDDDSLTEAFAAHGQNMDEFYRRVASSDEEDFGDLDDGSLADLERDTSDEEDFGDSDDGSVADLERDTWVEACSSTFQNAVAAFPLEAGDIRPAVVVSNRLFSGEELADTVVSVRGDVPMSPVLQVTDMGVAMIPPVADRPVQQTVNGSVVWDVKTDEVSVVSWPICMYVANTALTHSIRMCLLYPVGAGNLKGESVDSQRLDHRRTVIWDPGIVDSRVLSVCYDCLCLMALFRAVISLVHHWAEWSVWTGPDAWYCQTIAWEERYLPRLHPPCVVDRLCGYSM